MDNDERKWIWKSPPLTRVTATVVKSPLPWEVLTADDARKISRWHKDKRHHKTAEILSAYADAVDAMQASTRIEYETA